MTTGDKWSTGITIVSGIAIAYVLEMHREGVDLIPKSVFEELRKFDTQHLLEYEKLIKKEIKSDMKQL